jgi:hypothetical protein
MRLGVLSALLAVLAAILTPGPAQADGSNLRAKLRGVEEVPAVSTAGAGEFRGEVNKDGTEIEYKLTYALEGAVQQAHIHIAQKGVNGGIVLFLCTNLGNAPATVPVPPACPASPGEVSGTLTAANVVAQASQGISTGEFSEVLRAILRGVAYANVHSSPNHGGGEIRGQIKVSHGHWDDD